MPQRFDARSAWGALGQVPEQVHGTLWSKVQPRFWSSPPIRPLLQTRPKAQNIWADLCLRFRSLRAGENAISGPWLDTSSLLLT